VALTRKLDYTASARNETAHSQSSSALFFSGKVPRLIYLDGLRGLVALYVVIFHAFFFQHDTLPIKASLSNQLYHLFHLADYLFQYGHLAVVVFIVLSGYSLMLSFITSSRLEPEATNNNSIAGYLKRRARRILPPYYAALSLSVLLLVLIPDLQKTATQTGNVISWHNYELPALTPKALLTHLLLVHNWFFDTHVAINSPLWSIGLEWQLYFALAFVFLPLWRRFGSKALFGVGLFIALGAHSLTAQKLFYAYPGLIGIFVLGMFGAVVSFGKHQPEQSWREQLNWKGLAALAGLLFLLLRVLEVAYRTNLPFLNQFWPRLVRIDWLQDTVVGLIVIFGLIHFARIYQAKPGTEPWLLRLLKTEWLTSLGQFSYSLYLSHAPVLVLMGLGCARFHLAQEEAGLVVLLLGVPVSVGVAYLFHLTFERPFLTKGKKSQNQQVSFSEIRSREAS
jgi:peptidoglycan/LPS O-acetylase OafA/YrhL